MFWLFGILVKSEMVFFSDVRLRFFCVVVRILGGMVDLELMEDLVWLKNWVVLLLILGVGLGLMGEGLVIV